ncbi:uncharacterized protein LOC101889680 [Musca domestica]|uniref:Uncharacterized protein LOC101889680 n=1 Tax=Musca domestica TaxID=7370 RepID=A0A9J7DD06_MUSDO|nr:uncharacterized protein LOC101889680 [Musca domestica]
MNRKTIFALIFCILAVRLSKGKGSYIAVAPKTIRPNSEYAVSVTLPENTVPALAEVSITSPTYNASQTIEFEDYKTSVARFNTPPNLNNGTYTLKVRGLSGVEFFNSTDLIYENGDNAMEVVTEQPDETLKNITAKRFGPLKLNFKREVRRVANDRLIKINATEPIKYAIADVMANGKIVKHQYFNIGGEHTTDYITITPTTDMIPKANIFVYYIQNDTLIWRDLTMFFANTSDCENNNTEYHRLLLGNDEDNSELTTPTQLPGEQSGLLTLTDANYGTERSK